MINSHVLSMILETGLKEAASIKTSKYVLGNAECTQQIIKVADTLIAIMAAKSSIICVNQNLYNISDYEIPTKLVDLMSFGQIYASNDAIGKKDPIYAVAVSESNLTPTQFNKFFSDYNSGQQDNNKINVQAGLIKTPKSLDSLQYLVEDENGMMLKYHESGLGIEACQLLSVELPALNAFLTGYTRTTIEGMGQWLFS